MLSRLVCASLLLLGCDDPRPRHDPDPRDGSPEATSIDEGLDSVEAGPTDVGPMLDSALQDRPTPDSGPFDARRRDGPVPDGPVPDGPVADGPVPDGPVPDGPVPDGPVPDGPAPVDAGLEPVVSGLAHAADARERVTVTASELRVETDELGRFELPLPAGRHTLRFAAPNHQEEALEIDVGPDGLAVEEEVVLYRGRRLSRGEPGRALFRFDDGWLLWDEGDVLYDTRTEPVERRVLVASEHEVVIGFAPGEESVVTRIRTELGLAGDLYLVPLDGAPRTRLLIEAQPWARWVRDRILGMVHTREALSELRSVVPGEGSRLLADGVPWLLVTTLAEGEIAWVEGGPIEFDVFRGSVDGEQRMQISPPEAPASDRLLLLTPGARGVLWLTPDDALWRWEPALGAVHLADDVLESPRPSFRRDGRLRFWREDAQGADALYLHDGADARLLVDGAAGRSYSEIGDAYFVERPGRGLWRGTFDGEGADLVEGAAASIRTSGGGVVALVDGVAWRVDGEHPERVGGEGLTALTSATGGGTAWRQEDRTLWYVPGPGTDTPLTRIAEGSDGPQRVAERGGEAIYARGGEGGFYRVPLPATEPVVRFEREVTALTPIDAARLLGRDPDGALWQIDPRTGEAFGWARGVTRVIPSVRRGYVAYVCDRGLFLAPTPE